MGKGKPLCQISNFDTTATMNVRKSYGNAPVEHCLRIALAGFIVRKLLCTVVGWRGGHCLFIRERMVTTGSTRVMFFMGSIRAFMALAAVGPHDPFGRGYLHSVGYFCW